MDHFDPLSVLLQKRISIEEHVNSFDEFLVQFNVNDVSQIAELQIRYNTVVSCFSNFDEICDQIQLIDAETNHNPKKKEIQNLYFKVLAKAQSLISSIMPANSMNGNGSVASAEIGNNSVSSINRRKLKLPQAELPTFSGKIEEWLSFKDTFNAMIHKHDDITNVEKLQYLKSVLRDEALRKIQVFSITDENYDRAWNLLQKSYEDKRVLISRHLSLLLRLPVQENESYQGLITLADESQQHLQSLATLGINITPEIIVAIIEEKLHKSTMDKWDETVNRGEFPKLEDLTDFLYRTAARLSKRKLDDSSTSNPNAQGPSTSKKRKPDSKHHMLMITNSKKCPLCSESHLLFKCGKFLSLSTKERFKVVKEASLCFNCLRGHKSKDWKFGNCKKCSKKHNTLLHFTKSDHSEKSEDSNKNESKNS